MNTDWLALLGTVAVVIGLFVIWPPLALVVLGVIMVTISLLLAWAKAVQKRGPNEDDEQA